MTDYTDLVKALRWCADESICRDDFSGEKCPYYDVRQDSCSMDDVMHDAAAAIEELQQIADNYEQTAKDYWKEACEYKAQLPKRGEWIEDEETYPGQGLSNYKCSSCGKFGGSWRRGLKADQLPSFCGNCGADMRKMEVQE